MRVLPAEDNLELRMSVPAQGYKIRPLAVRDERNGVVVAHIEREPLDVERLCCLVVVECGEGFADLEFL